MVYKASALFNPFAFSVTADTSAVPGAAGLRVARNNCILSPMLNIRAAHMCRCCPMRSRTTGRAGGGIGARARVGS